MNKKYYCLLLFVVQLLFSCANNCGEIVGNADVLDISNPKQVTLGEVFSELEVIRMDAGTQSFFPEAKYVLLCGDKYVFADWKRKVYVFDKNGHFISSSKSVEGKGHGEYIITMGSTYNPYSNNIEIITPLNLMFYDMNFKFIKSVPLPAELPNESNNNHAQLFDYIYDLSDHLHILISSSDVRGQCINTLFIFDSDKQEVIKKISFDEDVMGYNTAQAFPFLDYENGELLFFPPRYSKYVYKFDKDNLELQRFISFNYGDEFYTAEDLTPILHEEDSKKYFDFLENNYKRSPLRFSYDKGRYFIFVDSEKDLHDSYMLIVDTKANTVKSLPFAKDGGFQFGPHSFVADNMLYLALESEPADSLIAAFPGKVTEINKYKADSTVNDNIAVLKYHLK